MIIRRPGTGRRNATILTAALAPTGDTTTGPQRPPAFGDPGPRTNKRRQLHDRVEVEAAVARLAADGSNLLDDMEDDDGRDPFDLAERFERDFDGLADAAFGSIADPARKATAFRKLNPVRARLMAAAQVMQEETEDRRFADTVFNSAETVLARAPKDPEATADHLERVAGVIDMTDLSDERKEQVATAVAARAITAGLEDLLGPKIKKHVPAGRRFLAGLRTPSVEDDGATAADASRNDAPASGEGIAASGEFDPNATGRVPGRDPSAQNNVPPRVSPSPAPPSQPEATDFPFTIPNAPPGVPELRIRVPRSPSEDVELRTTDPKGKDVPFPFTFGQPQSEDPGAGARDIDFEAVENSITRISGLFRGTIDATSDNPLTFPNDTLSPEATRHRQVTSALTTFFTITRDVEDAEFQSLALRAGLDEPTAVLFHEFAQVTRENLSDIRKRVAEMMKVEVQRLPVPLREALDDIAKSRPEDRPEVIAKAYKNIARHLILAAPLSDEQRKEALDDIANFVIDIEKLRINRNPE